MADFVAVIRRTVDGLSENTPEMRGKVYEKARSAVRRQLENMSPRPSDDMINRQLNKLEQAIGEVESEYAEALPAVEDAGAVEPGVAETAIEQEPPASVEPETAASAPEPEQAPSGEPIEEPASEEPSVEQPVSPTPVSAEAGDEEPHAAPINEAAAHEPDAAYDDGAPSEPAREAETEEPTEETAAQWPSSTEEQPAAREREAERAPPVEHIGEPEPRADELHGEQVEPQPDHAEPVHSEPLPSEEETNKSATSEWALPEWEDTPPTTQAADTQAAPEDTPSSKPELLGIHPVEPEEAEPAQHAREAEPSRSWSFDDGDPFATTTESKKDKAGENDISEWSWPVEKAPVPASQEERASTAWDHIDDLLGFGENNGAAAAANGAAKENGREQPPVSAPARPSSYRATPKPSRFNFKRLAIGAVIALLLGSGGYAYWQNREAGNAWLSGVIAKIMPAAPEAPETPDGQNAPAGQSSGQPGAPDETARPEDSSTKFTQRLLADGSEADDGPAGANGTEVSQEGKSVAPQTEAGPAQIGGAAPQPPAGEQAATAQGRTAGQNAGQTPQAEISVADGEKMFLYEERLGQSSPTAIPGTVAWSIKDESPGGDAKPEPAIQAQITVPDRGLTALMTIKRNADPSLPASHVVEFVFSLPENFEGGAIDSVQRVSMKRTEQDRGDPLIAVPAKITDDFHMIALNDFAEAVSNNTELLRSRSWIDIPITYRNGRRALLTLEKGAAGVEAFNKAMQAWSSLGNTAASSQ
ncbi:hypothetical protein PZN02_001840 [Sinorhizobium garamanticum]|uniref:Transcription regulator n=1 Tax=Sinorhizobium garamanticum TaxID=680247 RepID=A0ABY8DEG5_9HYPH|nr:hypothetical protein [Sinorhizobium garamanticum]WEX89280.1 hypothetical protein PZN02_001840 [Sinorhizobium garamanticum]